MDLVAGALGLLPSKLLELLKEEYKLQKGVRQEVQSLTRELESMHAALRKVVAVPWDQLDEQVKVWAREVREASYDMEDILDTFLVRVDGQKEADPSKLKRAMKKMGDLFSKGKARREISCAIEDITKQLKQMTERHAMYRIDDLVVKPAATTSIDPRLSALYTKVSQLVGIEEPRDKVIKMLTSVAEDMETKIVSIVGFGGLGKTTLAKAVYENLADDVRFKAFVPVGRNPDLKKVLKDILIGLDKQRYMMQSNFTILDEKQLIDELRDFLKDKRYTRNLTLVPFN
jgi:predicted AAA+ superfamily ATPase